MEIFYTMNKYFVFCIFLISCKLNQKQDDQDITYFKDFDFFKNEGVSSIDSKNLKYPYVSVEDLDTMLRLQFYFSAKEIAYDYLHKRNDYWISRTDSIKEMNTQYFVTYYHNEKLYRIEYHLEKNIKYLDQFIILIPKSENVFDSKKYFFSDTKKIDDLPWKVNYNDWIRKEENIDSISNGVLNSLSLDFRNGKKSKSLSCYKLGNYSFNYFNYFPFKFKKIDCEQ